MMGLEWKPGAVWSRIRAAVQSLTQAKSATLFVTFFCLAVLYMMATTSLVLSMYRYQEVEETAPPQPESHYVFVDPLLSDSKISDVALDDHQLSNDDSVEWKQPDYWATHAFDSTQFGSIANVWNAYKSYHQWALQNLTFAQSDASHYLLIRPRGDLATRMHTIYGYVSCFISTIVL